MCLETEHLSIGSLFGNHRGGGVLYWGLCEEGETLLYKETLFIETPGDMFQIYQGL